MKLCKTTWKPLRTTLSYTVGPVSIPLSRHTYSLTDGWAWWSRICQNKAVHSIHWVKWFLERWIHIVPTMTCWDVARHGQQRTIEELSRVSPRSLSLGDSHPTSISHFSGSHSHCDSRQARNRMGQSTVNGISWDSSLSGTVIVTNLRGKNLRWGWG